MPLVKLLLVQELALDTMNTEVVEHTQLLLPSSLTSAQRTAVCTPTLLDFEWRLRRAAAFEALGDLRRALCLTAQVFGFRRRRTLGQRENTRVGRLKESTDRRTKFYADTYRRHRAMMLVLDPNRDDWTSILKPLEAHDVKPLKTAWMDKVTQEKMQRRSKKRAAKQRLRKLRDEGVNVEGMDTMNLDNESESRRILSWIWMIPGSDLVQGQGEFDVLGHVEGVCFFGKYGYKSITNTMDSSLSSLHRVVQGSCACPALGGATEEGCRRDALCIGIPSTSCWMVGGKGNWTIGRWPRTE